MSNLMQPLVVDNHLPAGNAVCLGVEGNLVRMTNELRDTEGDWFYWKFRVAGAAGRTLEFRFEGPYDGHIVGPFGPVFSRDKGRTWQTTQPGSFTESSFSFVFGENDAEVWFAQTRPYLPENWSAFCAAHPEIVREELCKSRKGRSVEVARIGGRNAPVKILATCRHHCQESSASFVLEGLAKGFLADDETGRWWRGNADIAIVPFVDHDGAVDGDQGKNRTPHDHNRDYGPEAPLYPEVRAIKELASAWPDGPTVFFDLHSPWIRGGCNERLFFVEKNSERNTRAQRAFGRLISEIGDRPLGYTPEDNIKWGQDWNREVTFAQGLASLRWALASFPKLRLGTTFEVPFQASHGIPVTPASAGSFGEICAKALRSFLLKT